MIFRVESNGRSLYCSKAGEGELLLLIHGVVSDSDYFADAVSWLSGNYTVVTYDRIGYTRSEASPGEDYSVSAQAEDAARIIRFLGMGPALVVGCSAGGIIALELARKRPELVKKLLLHEPPLGAGEEPAKRLSEWRGTLREDADEKRPVRAMIHFIKALGGVDKRAPKRSLEAQKRDLENLDVFLYHEMEDMLSYLPENAGKIHLRMPCFIAVGEKDEGGLFAGAAADTADLLSATLLRAPGYHNFASELPRDFAVFVTGVMNLKTESGDRKTL